jgi:hypothetical protein
MAKKKRTGKTSDFGGKEGAAADGSQTALVQKAYEELGDVAPPEAVSPQKEEKLSGKSPSPAEKRFYTMGSWRGFPQWKCELCPWDTLEGEEKMLEHLASAHAPPPEPKSPILIADKSGKQIN